MGKNHLKRINAPKTWPVMRKTKTWILKPKSSHKNEMCMPVSVVMREVVKCAGKAKEAKLILRQGSVLVNKKARKDPNSGVGLMDVMEIPDLKQHFRMLMNKQGKLVLHPIDEKESSIRLCKINGKKILKAGKMQLVFSDGSTMLSDNKEYKAGDTLVISMPGNKVKEHLKFEKGALVYITSGKQSSLHGKLEEVRLFKGAQPDNIVLSDKGKKYETRKEYAMVIGKDKPVISLVE
ncbi:MAG: 30S ribosomal protein S4e [Nanoarchaeota archaeon]|nr:30S ribosomal protein S4e [Nanoarchaeota archaeon]